MLLVSSAVFLAFLFLLGTGLCRELGKVKIAVLNRLETRTKNEQLEHSKKIEELLRMIESDFFSLHDSLLVLESSDGLDFEQKKELLLKLRAVEETAVLLEDRFSQYFSDNSIQYSPYADGEVTSFVYESRNLAIALERFVRQSELILLGSQGPSEEQAKLLLEQYYEISWYLEKLIPAE